MLPMQLGPLLGFLPRIEATLAAYRKQVGWVALWGGVSGVEERRSRVERAFVAPRRHNSVLYICICIHYSTLLSSSHNSLTHTHHTPVGALPHSPLPSPSPPRLRSGTGAGTGTGTGTGLDWTGLCSTGMRLLGRIVCMHAYRYTLHT